MFSNPASGLMLMLLLGFVGLLVMFVFLMRTLAAQQSLMQERFSRLETQLALIEARLTEAARRSNEPGKAAPPVGDLAALLEGAATLPPPRASSGLGRTSADPSRNGRPLDIRLDS